MPGNHCHVASRKEAREPKTYILLVDDQTIGLLSHASDSRDSVVQWFGRQLTKDKTRVQSPVATKKKKKKKKKKLVVANIEI